MQRLPSGEQQLQRHLQDLVEKLDWSYVALWSLNHQTRLVPSSQLQNSQTVSLGINQLQRDRQSSPNFRVSVRSVSTLGAVMIQCSHNLERSFELTGVQIVKRTFGVLLRGFCFWMTDRCKDVAF